MTDRHKGYVITLDKDIREDDAQPIIDMIAMIKGVIAIRPVINDPVAMIAEERALQKVRDKLFEFLYPWVAKKTD